MIRKFLLKRAMKRLNIQFTKVENISRKSKLLIDECVNFKSVSIDAGGVGEKTCHIESFSLFMDGTIHTLSRIGRFCSIGPYVRIGGKGHPLDWLSTHAFQYRNKKIAGLPEKSITFQDPSAPPTIGNDVWIGADVTILRGVNIADGAVIASGAVVSKNVAPYEIVGGIPAKHIGFRFKQELIDRLLKVQWWLYNPANLEGLQFDNVPTALDELEQRIKSGKAEIFQPKKIIVENRGLIG